jgi:hypothetical protein
MPKLNIADIENLIESEEDFQDKREQIRKKIANSRFKESKIEDHGQQQK